MAQKHGLGWMTQNINEGFNIDTIIGKVRKSLLKGHAVSLSLNGPWINGVLETIHTLGIPVVPINIIRIQNQTTNIVYVNFGKEISTKVDKEFLLNACNEIKAPSLTEETLTV